MTAAAYVTKIGKWMMKKNHLSIIIADDEDVYFNKKMLHAAEAAGYYGIKRISFIDHEKFSEILANPPDIIITDVRGVCSPDVAKDGIELARVLVRETHSMVVITSAHRFHLNSSQLAVHHIIDNRHLTSTDFVNELSIIISKLLDEKVSFYKMIGFKVGWWAAKFFAKAN